MRLITLLDKLKRWFLHDSAHTGQDLSLDPVANDGSSNVRVTDLSATLGYLHLCFWKQKKHVLL